MNKIIEVRSETYTKPNPARLEAMMSAPVGDDISGEDVTVNTLEKKMRNYLEWKPPYFTLLGI
ncbi:MAG: beta-eliminating lyase-related protein [Chitinophagales bacterium]